VKSGSRESATIPKSDNRDVMRQILADSVVEVAIYEKKWRGADIFWQVFFRGRIVAELHCQNDLGCGAASNISYGIERQVAVLV